MFKDKTVITSIITGLISSAIFLIFFQPIFEFLSKMFVKFASNFYDGLIDSVYLKAATVGFSDTYGGFITHVSSGLFVGMMISSILIAWSKKTNIVSGSKAKILYYIFPWYALLGMVLLGYALIFNNSAYQSYTLFMQRVTAITPYTTDAEIKRINSKWALMKKKNDYIELNKLIDEIAKANQLDVPKPY